MLADDDEQNNRKKMYIREWDKIIIKFYTKWTVLLYVWEGSQGRIL